MHDSIQALINEVEKPTIERQPQALASEENTSDAPAVKETTPAEPVEELSDDVIANGADLSIGLFGLAQTSILSYLAKRRKNNVLNDLYGDDASVKLKVLLNEQSTLDNKLAEAEKRKFTDAELGMLRIEKDFQELLDDLPLTDGEKESIKVPLMQIMKTKGGSLPPEYALMISLMLVTGSRLGQIYI